jgi:hypothetical protein
MRYIPEMSFEEEYFFMFGLVVYTMAHLEHELFKLLGRILSNDHIALNLTAGCQLEPTLTNLRAAFYGTKRRKNTRADDSFEFLINKTSNIHRERNENIHALWYFNNDKKEATRWKMNRHKKGLVHATQGPTPSAEELLELSQRVQHLEDEIHTFGVMYFPRNGEKLTTYQRNKFNKSVREQIKRERKRHGK